MIHVNTLKVTFPNQILDSLNKFSKNKTWFGATLGLMELCNSSVYDYRFKAVVPSCNIFSNGLWNFPLIKDLLSNI